jgi:hypothetical protein
LTAANKRLYLKTTMEDVTMQLSKYTFQELMAELKTGNTLPKRDKKSEMAYAMDLIKRMAENRKEMDHLNKEFEKVFYVSPQCQSFFKR